MRNAKKEDNMQITNAAMPSLPTPKSEKKILRQAEINLDLWKAVEKEMHKRGLSIRETMEWGFRAFVLATNPKEALRLGITSDHTK